MYLVYEQLQDERGDASIDTDEEVDGGQKHVGRAGDGEQKGRWVHQRDDRPPETDDSFIQSAKADTVLVTGHDPTREVGQKRLSLH